MAKCETRNWGKVKKAPRVTLFVDHLPNPYRALRADMAKRMLACITIYPTGVLPPSTIAKSARKGKPWAVAIVQKWLAEKASDQLLGHRTINA